MGFALDPFGQPRHYNVGQRALFQKAQQLVLEEAGVSPEQANLLALSQQRQSFLEKLHHSTCCSAVAAAEPAVEQEVGFGQHRQQRMMTGPSVFAWIVSLQRVLLLTIAFQDGGIQVQAVTVPAWRQTLHLPLRQGIKETMHLAHAETAEEIADGVVAGKAGPAQRAMQGPIAT